MSGNRHEKWVRRKPDPVFTLRDLKSAKGGCRMDHTAIISLKNIVVEFDGEQVLRDISLDIHNHEFVTLLGPSGCGKTTTLRIIGGFVAPKSGDVFFDGEKINALPPYKREVNTIFQKYALFPHLDVFENIAFGLRLKKTPNEVVRQRVSEMLELVNLRGYEHKDVDLLSGGQQQRVAIARALINQPKVLLLDEPLGALDLKLRKEMQVELKKIQKNTQVTFIYVTHDQEEALTMSDTVVVMRAGEILQVGTPVDIYNEPRNAFVADFIGESNIIDGIMKKDYLVEFAGRDFECVDFGFGDHEQVDVVIRPEDIKVSEPEKGQISGVVESVIFKGVHYEIRVFACGYHWKIHSTLYEEPGREVGLSVIPDDIHIMHRMEETGNAEV